MYFRNRHAVWNSSRYMFYPENISTLSHPPLGIIWGQSADCLSVTAFFHQSASFRRGALFSLFLLLWILSSLADSGGAFFRKSVVPDTLPLSPRTPPGLGASEPRQEACLLRSFRFDYLLLPLSRLCSDYLSLPGSSTAGPTACRKSSWLHTATPPAGAFSCRRKDSRALRDRLGNSLVSVPSVALLPDVLALAHLVYYNGLLSVDFPPRPPRDAAHGIRILMIRAAQRLHLHDGSAARPLLLESGGGTRLLAGPRPLCCPMASTPGDAHRAPDGLSSASGAGRRSPTNGCPCEERPRQGCNTDLQWLFGKR